jgi:hypothetical protein
MTGTVPDSTGAVISGASIVLTNTANGNVYKAVTNSSGSYTLTNVTPGPGYKETVSHSGFTAVELTGLYLNVSTTRTQNVVLPLGSVQTTVSVSAANQDVTLNTTDATIGNNVQVQDLNELPVSFRDSPAALFTSEPGMTQDGSATGGRTDQNGITLDGLDVTDQSLGTFGTIVANAPVDSVQEFRGTVAGMTSNDNAGGGAQFSLVTKGGSNKFHGNINEYHRDTDLEANEWFNNYDGIARSPLIRNQFGGNFSGPVTIPHLFSGKDRLFFFFDYNGRRDTVAAQAVRTVPTTSFQNQNINYFTNITSGTTDSINAAQVAGFDPQGKGFDQPLLTVTSGRYPAPNDTTVGDLLNTAGFRFNSPTPFKENNYVGRLDLKLTSSHSVFGRVTYNKINSVSNLPQFPGDPETYPNLDTSHAWVVGWNWAIGSNKSNSLIWGATVANLSSTVAYAPTSPNEFSYDGDPTGGSFLDNIYANPGGSKEYFPIPVVRDDFAWQKGKHTISIGGDFKYPTPHYTTLSDFTGSNIGLGGGILGLPANGSSNFNFRPNDLDVSQTSATIYDSALVYGLGRFASASETWNYNASGAVLPAGSGLQTTFKYYTTEFYFSDTWKITPTFTLTYGLRYQNFSVPYEIHGIESVQSESFKDFMDARIAQSAAGVGGVNSLPGGTAPVPYITYALGGKKNNGPSYYAPDNKDFAPRVAFAWTPTTDRKLVINGGAGLVYDETIINALLQEQANYSYLFQSQGAVNFGLQGTSTQSAAYLSLLNNPRFTSLSTPAPGGPTAPMITKPYAPFIGPGDPNCNGVAGGNAGPCGLAQGGAFNITVDRNLPTPYNMMFNVGMEQQLGAGLILKLNYVNRLGRRLLAQADAEQLIDFPDKVSGQSLSQAMANLTTWLRQNPNADPTTAPPQPFFENVLYNNNTGVSNTGYIANTFAPYPARGDVADSVELMSLYGLLPYNVGMASQFSENTFFTDGGFSSYNGLLATIHKNASHGLQFDINYTWSHSIDNVSQKANSYAYTGYGFLCDILRPRICRASSDFDVANYINGTFLYQLPFGRGRDFAANIPWWANEVVGGWELSGVPTWHTGTPFMANSLAFLMSYSNEDPAILVGNIGDMKSKVTKQSSGVVTAFKDSAKSFSDYVAPVGFEYGTRNNLRGPGFFLLDLGLGKTFTVIPNKLNLKFRADAFNVLNHPNFQAPSFQNNMSLVANPQEFGAIPGTVIPNGADQSARVLQGSLRLEF